MIKRILLLFILLIITTVSMAQSIRRDNTLFFDTIRGTICDTNAFVWDTLSFNTPGIYSDTLPDSTVHVFVISQHYSVINSLYDTICNNATYSFFDTTYNVTGTYVDSSYTLAGCDSIVVLNLKVYPAYEDIVYDTICFGDTIFIGDTLFVDTSDYTFLDISSHGCDSITHYHLIVNPTFVDSTIFDTICYGVDYAFGDTNYTDSGFYRFVGRNIYGCDSIATLSLMVHPSYENSYDDTICFGDTASFGDTIFVKTDSYTFYDITNLGCDSITHFNLLVNPTYVDSTIYDTICKGVEYAFGDTTYSDSGFFQFFGTTINGCDSVATLSLYALANSDTTIYDTIFEPDLPWSILDTMFMDSVVNLDLHTTNAVGCDSTIHYNLYIWWDPDHCEHFIQFPNLVTPNGDGVDDIFEIKGLVENQCYPTNDLAIYDRWGHRVFHAENIYSIDQFWDPGKTRSPSGTYFFRFFGRGHNIFIDRKGTIEVLREAKK